MPQNLKRFEQWAIWLFGLIIILMPILGIGSSINKEVQTSAEIANELNYLLTYVGPNHADFKTLKANKIAEIIKFVSNQKEKGVLYYPEDIDGITSSYYEVDVFRSLDQILQLTDNPEIPSVFTAPSTIRLSRWKTIETNDLQRPKLWEQLPNLNEPISFSGIETVVNTPDENTGAYYEYDLFRSVILTKYNGRNMLISLSKQVDTSNVGRKGLIIGQDDQWDYFYSDQVGLNRAGLSWVDSYIYNSKSVAFYLESASSGSMVRIGVFKWLRAGWYNINFVERSHIYDGLDRFTRVLKQIAEHPSIAHNTKWVDTLHEIQHLPKNRLQPIIQDYLHTIQKQAHKDHTLSSNEIKAISTDNLYMNSLDRDEMQAILTVEFLKQLMGKQSSIKFKADEMAH